MKYNVGDKVRIKSLDWYNENKDKTGDVPCGEYDFVSDMSVFCGKILTIDVDFGYETYLMKEDHNGFVFTEEMIEGLVEEEKKPEFKVGDEVIAYAEGCLAKFSINDVRWNNELNKFEYKICSSWYDASVMQLYKESNNFLTERVSDNGLPFNEWLSHKGAFHVPEDYVLKDENGNVINATKIVLEKKKKEYPKTYEECAKELGYNQVMPKDHILGYKGTLLSTFQQLLICRAAYWKIAGEEMGFGKPWAPDWLDDNLKPCIGTASNEIIKCTSYSDNTILVFPTEEMRDAFKENFDPDIEICKELL